ncbi:hypothetical protein PGT21_026792 [Puccinia graminis f. sp. tritici]|uniref:Uncharacterized protein n=1 Tax=Puccinia graminis f. sp. tritici TaxID=56615 RepID=A0A5B0PV15_PUCGR|nr:hypothetical protein PGT21_026792 [Puccinia graminis f. sp. tritici]
MTKFIFGSLTILLSLLERRASAYEVTLDSPINPNNTIQKFTLQRKLSWTNQDFVLYKQNSTAPIIKIENHMANQLTGFFGLDLTFPDGRYLDVKANAGQVVCGFRQIYEISDGVRFRIDPRGIHSDRWKIDKSGNLTANYTWYRNQGNVRNFSLKMAWALKLYNFDQRGRANRSFGFIICHSNC